MAYRNHHCTVYCNEREAVLDFGPCVLNIRLIIVNCNYYLPVIVMFLLLDEHVFMYNISIFA